MNLFLRTSSSVFLLESQSLPETTAIPEVAHHAFVVDQSGSMYGDISPLKATIEQVLAVESMSNSNVETSLISFSSHGDVTLHWNNVPVSEVTELSSPYLGKLRGIQAKCFTGISQGLNLALKQVKPGQTTGITLFTDGYANDPSSYEENKSLDKFVQTVKDQYPNVFLNVIGYRDWCDWPRMSMMANALSGKCVKATSFKSVLESMRDTQSLLSGRVRPAYKLPAKEATALVAINLTTGQVNFSPVGEALVLQGGSADDSLQIFRVTQQAATSFSPRGTPEAPAYIYGALANAFASMGQFRTAKELLFASGNVTLWEEHQSAMTPSTVAAMQSALTQWVQAGDNTAYTMGINVRPPYNLLDLVAAINKLPSKSLGLDSASFNKGYRRRSIQSLPGKRLDDGTIQPNNAKMIPREGARTYVRSMTFNRSDASVQMGTEQATWVERLSDGKVFQEVDFISLEGLRDFRSYTLISSGERNVNVIPLEVYTQNAWEALLPYMDDQNQPFAPGKTVSISLKKFRLETDSVPAADTLHAALLQRLEAEAKVKILSGLLNKEEASPYTPEQIESLKALHLSPALYFSSPSHVHYTDKNEAASKGLIDSFTKYKINFGLPTLLSSKEFRSGNAFLDRRYKVTVNGQEVKKPKLDTYHQGAVFTVKPPGKGAESQADQIMARVADPILISATRMSNDEIKVALSEAERTVEAAYNLFQGLVLEVGCTGLLPRELETLAIRSEPEVFATTFGLKLGADEKEGMYYAFHNGLVISIVPETAWYTV